MYRKKFSRVLKLEAGFTLIELLIVIAILAILATVVLIAINPTQKLARTRDVGRISTVSQLGHAMQAYYTANSGEYPQDFDTLVTVGELTRIPSEITNTLTTTCLGVDDAENGWCYAVDNVNHTFTVWSALESDTYLNRVGCGGVVAFATYLSDTGNVCIVCDTPPTAATVASDCD